jgi:hypothetical protein
VVLGDWTRAKGARISFDLEQVIYRKVKRASGKS